MSIKLPITIENKEYDHFITPDEFDSINADSKILWFKDSRHVYACIPVMINRKGTEIGFFMKSVLSGCTNPVPHKMKKSNTDGFILLRE